MKATSISNALIALLLVLALGACTDKNALYIKGTVDHPKKIKTAYLLKVDSTQTGGMTIVDSVALSDGDFSFKRNAPYPELYQVLVGGLPLSIIARNGEVVKLKLDAADSSMTYKVSGSEDSEKMQEFTNLSNHYANITGAINMAYEKKIKGAKNKADSDAVLNTYLPLFQKNMADGSMASIKFMNANKSSLAAFYAALSLDKYKYEQQLVAYADAIKGKFADNLAVRNFINAMNAVKPVSVGHKAPDFVLIDSDNQPVKLSDYKGKYVMLDFWASWCAPCRQENPNVVKAYAQFKDKGLNILGITLDEDRKAWLAAVAADKLTWRHAAEFKRFDGPTVKLYRVEAIPSNFIIDPQGVIIAKNIAGAELEEFLNKTFNK